jgi:hypothetical protein
MYSFAIIRIEKRSLSEARAMAEHALRDGQDVPNADPDRRSRNRVLIGPATARGVMQTVREVLPLRRRKDAVPVVEAFVGMSPEVAAKWDDAKFDAYFSKAVSWIGSHFGGIANVKSAVVHFDEKTPHLQLLLVPLDAGRLRANGFIGGPSGLRQLQTKFANEVGSHFGLVRGQARKPGDRPVTHQHVGRFYAAIGDDALARTIPPAVDVPEAPSATRQIAIAANEKHLKALRHWANIGIQFAKYHTREMRSRIRNAAHELTVLEERANCLRQEVAQLELQREELGSPSAF